jgi:hypothetical protein
VLYDYQKGYTVLVIEKKNGSMISLKPIEFKK